MDWAQDNAGISENGYESVFKYVPRESTVVKMLGSDQNEATVTSLESDREWSDFCESLPNSRSHKSGLVLLLARQEGEAFVTGPSSSLTSWHQYLSAKIPSKSKLQKTETFATLSEKPQITGNSTGVSSTPSRRGVRTLPFSQEAFRRITHAFYTHGSVAKVISRTDVPVFSCEEAIMEEPAYVYNFRTSNAWIGDRAMSATFFPRANLTFAIVYGCSLSVEKEIISRLILVEQTQIHPLLIPAILAELEMSRHAGLVKSQMMKLELRILESRFNPDDLEAPVRIDVGKQNEAKRSALLDTTYLKNGLVTWITQISKMTQHIQELEELALLPNGESNAILPQDTQNNRELSHERVIQNPSIGEEHVDEPGSEVNTSDRETVYWEEQQDQSQREKGSDNGQEGLSNTKDHHDRTEGSGQKSTQEPCQTPKQSLQLVNLSSNDSSHYEKEVSGEAHAHQETETLDGRSTSRSFSYKQQHTKRTDTKSFGPKTAMGKKIGGRLRTIQDEYEDWVRDCEMRVDGLALAARWTEGETNVEIALSTRQDSRYMRSIALVTMIFLPGTWLAGVFSMTFFEWHSDSGGANVSEYIWIYAVVTLILTALTVGCWYFVTIYRPKQLAKGFCKEE